jgi:hypothetical protein
MNNLRFLHSIKNGISYYFINDKRVSKMTYEARFLMARIRKMHPSNAHTICVGESGAGFNQTHVQYRLTMSY